MPAIVSRTVLAKRHPAIWPNQLAQQSSTTSDRRLIEWSGELTEASQQLEDGRYYNSHRFEGLAGEEIAIELMSEVFDAYLILQGPAGMTVAENDDGEGTNSRIVLTLPDSGAYTILANTSAAGETGAYQLEVRAATERDQQLARADVLNQQAGRLRSMGRYQEGIEQAEEGLALRRSLLGERHPDVAASLNILAGLYRVQERYEEAEALYRESLSIRREQLGERHLDVAASLNNLAELYRVQERYEEAKPLYEESLSIWREQLGDHHSNVAVSLNNLALLYEAQGQYEEAKPLYEESLLIWREQLGESHPYVATSLNNLAALYYAQEQYEAAEPLYEKALLILREQLGDLDLSVIVSLNNLAKLYEAQGRYEEAEARYEEALSIRREQLGDRHPDVALSLNNLALLYVVLGRYGEAEPLYKEALSIRREQLGDRHSDVALSLNNLAELYREQGRYGEAEPLYEEALSIGRKQLGDRHPDVALSLNNLAGLYEAQGRYREAEPLHEEALSILRGQLGDRHLDVATSLNNLAALHYLQAQYGEAEPLYKEALSILRGQLGDRHLLYVAKSLNNLAELFRVQAQYGEAEPLYKEALSILRGQLGERHPDVAVSLNNLAVLYMVQGHYGEAKAHHEEALSILRGQLGERHPDVAVSLNNLAELYTVQERVGEAINALQAGLDIEEWNLELNLASLAEAQRQAYAATISETTDRTISLSLHAAALSPAAQQLALTTLLRRKGRILEAGASSLRVLRQNLTRKDQATFDELQAVRQSLAALIFNRPATLPLDQYGTRISELEAEANGLETTLARNSAAFRVETEPVEIAAVQAQLPANGVLVEYVRYRPYDSAADRFDASRYAAYLLFPDGGVKAVDLGEAAEIETAIRTLAQSLADRNTPATTIEQQARALDEWVFAPLRADLSPADRLLISPDGALNLIPFEVLRSPDKRYLVEDFAVSYLNSGRELTRLDLTPPSDHPPVILAYPSYGQANVAPPSDGSRSVDLGSLTVAPLDWTYDEGRSLSARLPKAVLKMGSAATETYLKQMPPPPLLHIATHGIFLADAPRRVVVEAEASLEYEIPSENPLLRSMLALANFNSRGGGDSEDDGVFTALEASGLNLYGTELVTLSACETGQGEVRNGEGVYGLRRSFALAGAESLLMSLWRVEDKGAAAFMERYYDTLLSGVGRSDSLRRLQLEMIRSEDAESRHPYRWAAFVLTGDWRPWSLN
ncbi:MAG: CHAT domain-containing protein [Pseudanabaenales cyanobacterium]|nr:CHAT domain-containing protein [Pseudanabaenales cyanobacterium]